MSATLPIFDYAALGEHERAFIERTIGSFAMLSQVLEWGMKLEPPVAVNEIVTQDEYTHDILMELPDGRYLSLDLHLTRSSDGGRRLANQAKRQRNAHRATRTRMEAHFQ